MNTDDAVQPPAEQAFATMTDDQAAAWVRAGDYSTVAGIRLAESVSKKFTEVLSKNELPSDNALPSDSEVEGFDLPCPPTPAGPVPIPYPNLGFAPTAVNMSALYKHCAQGTHFPAVKIT